MNPLNGKKILAVIPAYYGYEKSVVQGLENLGATVVAADNRPFVHDPNNRGTPWYLYPLCKKNKYITNKLLPLMEQAYDLALFIDLFSFDAGFIKKLKKRNPAVKLILYLWDNVKGYKWQRYFSFFDEIYSFDPVESELYGLKYLPNFYPDVEMNSSGESHFEVCSIGSLQVHRLKMLEQLAAQLTSAGKNYFFYLYLPPLQSKIKYNPWIYRCTKYFGSRFQGYQLMYNLFYQKIGHELVKHKPLPLMEAIYYLQNAKCIIDLPFPAQTGSTQRVIQALALNKKVITTNESVTKESFYNPEYIRVVPLADFRIDWTWLNSKNKTTMNVSHLRLDRWLIRLLS
jgi:hypothetical protein